MSSIALSGARRNELKFWVHAEDGSSYPVDLTEFATGRSRDEVPPKARKSWGGDFQGRPGFSSGVAEVFRATCPSKTIESRLRHSCRNLLRFLDIVDPKMTIRSFDDLTDHHGTELKNWTKQCGWSGNAYKQIKALVDIARLASGARPLFWPSRDRDPLHHKDDVDFKGFQRMYTALKKEAKAIKAMFQSGHALADQGTDPRGQLDEPASWERVENHAWLVRELTKDVLPEKRAFYSAGASGLNKANDPSTQKHDGPAYLAPGMSERGRQGIVGKLRWFYPSYQDTAVFFWLFLIGIGWNLATTTVGMDVSERDRWCEDHPTDLDFKIMHAFKGRPGKHVFAPCLVEPEWHPYQIIEYMIVVTAPLRRTVCLRLKEAKRRHANEKTPETEAEVSRLERMSRSPWLYHVVNKVGEIGCLQSADSYQLNAIARLVAEKHGLTADHPTLTALVTGEARDAWIGHAYITSGNNILIARLAAQHADYRSLVHYLRRRRYRAQSEREIRRMQDLIFGDISTGRVLDPTRIRLALKMGKITPEVEKRLLDHRQRTRLGMGCLDPKSPPKKIAPDHVKGSICRIQRCTGCHLGIVFPDSLDALACARAELVMIKRSIPLAAWSGSSFEDEAESLDSVLAEFDPDAVREAIDCWLNRFLAGELQIHDTYPMY